MSLTKVMYIMTHMLRLLVRETADMLLAPVPSIIVTLDIAYLGMPTELVRNQDIGIMMKIGNAI